MFNNDFVFVYDCPRGEGLDIYTFVPDNTDEVFNSVVDRIEQNQREIADKWLICHGEDWRKKWRETFNYDFDNQYPNMRIISYDNFEKLQNEKLNDKPLHEITEERFYDLLECLPPVGWTRNALFEYFFMSEAYTGDWRDQVMRVTIGGKDRYFTKLRTYKNAYDYEMLIADIEGKR